jgi:DNA-binding CsgD family transcriptional regulator
MTVPTPEDVPLSPGAAPGPEVLDRLTKSERLILTFVAKGLSIKEMAARLHRSVETVKSHRRAINQKLGSRDRVAIARMAMEFGVVPGPRAHSYAAQQFLGSVVRGSGSVPIALIDLSGVVHAVSPGFARVLGRESDAITGRTIEELIRLDCERSSQSPLSSVAAGSSAAVPGVVMQADGGVVFFSAQFLPMPGPSQWAYLLLTDMHSLARGAIVSGAARSVSAA